MTTRDERRRKEKKVNRIKKKEITKNLGSALPPTLRAKFEAMFPTTQRRKRLRLSDLRHDYGAATTDGRTRAISVFAAARTRIWKRISYVTSVGTAFPFSEGGRLIFRRPEVPASLTFDTPNIERAKVRLNVCE